MKKYIWYLTWTVAGILHYSTATTGTELEFDYWWDCLDESTKQTTDLVYKEI